MTAKTLIIEDEIDIAELIRAQLQTLNLEADIITHGELAMNAIKEKGQEYSLFIIDRMLPGKNGIEVCELARSLYPQSPILMVTALTQSEDIIRGLDAGADDYITKPFDMQVLLARVRSQLRRIQNEKEMKEVDELEYHKLKINFKKCLILVEGKSVSLTHTEFQILCLLSQSPGHVFTRESLIKEIIGENVHVTNRTIDTHVAGLRKKLTTASSYIETIRGIGYRFTNLDE